MKMQLHLWTGNTVKSYCGVCAHREGRNRELSLPGGRVRRAAASALEQVRVFSGNTLPPSMAASFMEQPCVPHLCHAAYWPICSTQSEERHAWKGWLFQMEMVMSSFFPLEVLIFATSSSFVLFFVQEHQSPGGICHRGTEDACV